MSVGLATQSNAPSASASMVTAAPLTVSVDTMMTGRGLCFMTRRRKSMPFIFGISMSSVMTSGSSESTRRNASVGSGASPTTSMAGLLARAKPMILRMVALSSMIRTRTGLTAHSP